MKINNIVYQWPEGAHDANIFRNCNLRVKFENGDYGDSILVGDCGYGIKTILIITPLGNLQKLEWIPDQSVTQQRGVLVHGWDIQFWL